MNDKLCPVCAFEMVDGPRSFNICPSCGTEFGLHDENATIGELRAWWLSTGPRWHSTVIRQPVGWNPTMQLLRGTTFNAHIAALPHGEVANWSYVPKEPGWTNEAFQQRRIQQVFHRERFAKRKLGKRFIDSISNVAPYAATFHAVR